MSSFKTNALIYSTIVAIGGFIFGLDAALISGTVRFLEQEFLLTELQLGTVVSAPILGVLVALPFAGYIANGFGRKRAIQLVAVLYLVSAIASALAPDYWTLVAARFLGGLAFSSISLASMYIGEIAPPKLRGKLVSMTQINIVIGLSTAYFINYLILQSTESGATWVHSLGLDKNTWRWMLGSEILPALVWLVLLCVIPESPYWLVYRDRVDDARSKLRKLMPSEDISHHVDEMQASLHTGTEDRSALTQLKEIFGKPMRVTFIIAMTIAIAQQATGINAILFYAPTVIEQLGIGTDAAFQQAIWIGLTSIVFTVAGLLLVDRLGRRPLIIGGMVWIILSLGICYFGFKSARYALSVQAISELADVDDSERLRPLIGVEYESDIAFKDAVIDVIGEADAREHSSVLLQKSAKMNASLILFGILSFIGAFHFSVGPVMWVLFSEIFPISLRGIAIPFFTLATSLTSYFVQLFFPWQLANMGITTIFLTYAGFVAVGLVILYFYLRETKNMSIEEIQMTLRPNSMPETATK
jgi:SP family arabinose:H+ symporter-like MFS transporter